MTSVVNSSEIISTEPATGAILWRGNVSDVDREVAIARQSWADWGAKPMAVRIEAIRRFAAIVRAKSEALIDCIARETGKPLWEASSEVESVINKVEISISAYAERTSQRRIEGAIGAKSAVRHKPHGVMAVLGPYNFPAHLPNGHIIPALIAGNAIVFKPSEKTPAVGKMLVDLYHAAGIPTGVVRCVVGGPDIGKALTSHDGIDGVLFTGSARTGIILNRQFADQPNKILALEMGGNNPIVVWDTANIHMAAVLVVQSAFLSAGQRCTAASRLIVQDSLFDPLIKEVREIAERLIIGEPHSSPAPFMGPVIDNEAADLLQESFLTLMMKGGRPIKHLDRPSPNRPFLDPAIIDMTDAKETPDAELFGPILQVKRCDNFETAIAEANNTRYGLSAALIGGTGQHYDKFWANIRAGVINWNRPTNGAPSNAPFGGIGLSGNHRPSAFYAADYCAYPVVSTEEESIRASIGVGLKDAAASYAK